MPRKLTENDFRKRFNLKYKDYTLLSPFLGYDKKVTFKHNICGSTYSFDASYLLRHNYHCKTCKNTSMLKNKLKNKYNNKYTLHGNVKNIESKISITCNKCNYTWDIVVHNLIRRINSHKNHMELCPECRKKNNTFQKILLKKKGLTNEEFLNRVKKMTGDEYTFLDPYQGSYVKLNVRHNKCNFEFSVCPHDFYKGSGCPKCNASKGEKFIKSYLINNNIKFEREKTFAGLRDKKLLRFDFYLPDYNLCIEFDGIQHYKAQTWMGGEDKFKKQQYHDKLKNEFCKKHDIKLLRISYRYNTYKKVSERLDKIL